MADNALTVVAADATTKTLRSEDLGSNIQAQVVLIHEGPDALPVLTGATFRHAVTTTATALDPPDAGARYGRVRVYETSGPASSTLRLYYRTDGTNPTADGANAMGFLLHGEMIMVKLASPSNFRMIAEGTGAFQVYVEWLNAPSS